MDRGRKQLRLVLAVGGAVLVVGAVATFAGTGTAASEVAPRNQSPPTISGTPREGSTLTARPGRWTGTEPITFAYTFLRCDRNGGSCAAISGATDVRSRTYTLRGVDVGNTLRVRVTATNRDGERSATSVPTAVIRNAPTAPAPTGCAGNAPVQVATIAPPGSRRAATSSAARRRRPRSALRPSS